MRAIWAWVMVVLIGVTPVAAQEDDVVWIQIEARPSLEEATGRAAFFAGQLSDVAGFALGGSWYGIMLGPYLRGTAEDLRDVLIQEGRIPLDAYITAPNGFGAPFWPLAPNDPVPLPIIDAPESVTAPEAVPTLEPETAIAETTAPVAPPPVDETPQEARTSEATLSPEGRRQLQRALREEGVYSAAIDGDFGRGTRRAMALWQEAQGLEATGILTTDQRAVLMQAYLAPLTSVGMAPYDDPAAGIALDLPLGAVRFVGHEAPFARFDATSTLPGAQVLLISQPGDRGTLQALFEVIQTLEILPPLGDRSLARSGFVIEGRGPGLVSHAEARLDEGEIKGFVLAWPIGDEARRARVLGAMQDSFTRRPGTLRAAPLADGPDLLAALTLAEPKMSRSGMRVDAAGHVLTSSQAVAGCGRVTLGDGTELTPVASDTRLGLSLLKGPAPANTASPVFAPQSLALGTPVLVAGFPVGGAAGLPALSFGQLTDTGGAAGGGVIRMDLAHQPGDVGGPVLDRAGRVIGLLLASAEDTRALPDGLSVAADANAVTALLLQAGLTRQTSADSTALSPGALDRLAGEMAVMVQCWQE